MTVETQSNIVIYTGDASAVTFPFTFPVYDEEDLYVYKYTILTGEYEQYTLSTDYTVSGVGEETGGSITLDETLAATHKVIITRLVPLTQDLDVMNQGGFYPANVETQLDLMVMQIQQLKEEVGRAIRYPIGESLGTIPAAPQRISKLLGFGTAGELRLATTGELAKGDPGGNIMAIGLFQDAHTLEIPDGTDIVRTSGYSELGKGGAFYEADAAVDAAYVAANPRSAFISDNDRGFKLSLDQQINIQMFGAVGDNATDDSAAVIAAIALSYSYAHAGTEFPHNAGPSVFVPFGRYYMGDTLIELTHCIDFFGDGSIGPFSGAASQLRWDAGTHGIRLQSSNTSGDTDTGAQAYYGAMGSRIRNLYLRGGYAGTEGEFHGIYSRALVHVENVFIDNFQGDGLCLISHDTGGTNNCSTVRRLYVRQCRDGVRLDGQNSQAGVFEVFATENRRWAVWDSSFLGNLWMGLAENNGKTVGSIPTSVSHNGNWYAVVVGQEAGAATNEPSGDTTDNTWWYYMNAGAPNPAANVPAWTNGIEVRAGGAFYADNANAAGVILNWYAEPFQGPMQLAAPWLVIAGSNLGAGLKGTSAIRHSSFGVRTTNFHVTDNLLVGPTQGDVDNFNPATFFESTGDRHSLGFRTWDAGVPTANAQIMGKLGSGLFITGDPLVQFYIGAVGSAPFVAEVNENGIDVENTTPGVSGYYVGGLKVVGGQVAAIADAINAAGAPTQTEFNNLVAVVNAHLASDRSHGLIAT